LSLRGIRISSGEKKGVTPLFFHSDLIYKSLEAEQFIVKRGAYILTSKADKERYPKGPPPYLDSYDPAPWY